MKRTRLALLCFLLLLCAGCGSGAQSATTIPPTPTETLAVVPTPPTVSSHLVYFMTGDHMKLAGLLYGQGKTMVICSHMLNTTKDIWSKSGIPQRLAALGYAVLAYDFRGNGDSQGLSDPSTLDVDLRAAVTFARQQGATKIVLLGASMGGTASLKVATEETVTAVISLSGPQYFEVNVSDTDVKSITIPKLFLASQDDNQFVTDAQHMYAVANPPKEIHIYPGGAHGTYIFGGPNGDNPAQRVLRFIGQYAPAG
jgi:pimeloyl-ACP methyl ester carboxylesterase